MASLAERLSSKIAKINTCAKLHSTVVLVHLSGVHCPGAVMERWRGRVAFVTGASAGIGAAIAYQLQDAGVHVVAVARRADKIPAAVSEARSEAQQRGRTSIWKASTPGKLYHIKCDVSKEQDIIDAFKWAKDNAGGVDILVNNAGVIGENKLAEAPTEEWKNILDTNVLGLSICTREAIQQMKSRGVDDGHIIHINSAFGHTPPGSWLSAMLYASKHAVCVLTEGLRKELVAAKSRIRVSEVCPGSVKTEVWKDMKKLTAEQVYKDFPYLHGEDLADATLYVLSVPPHVQIHDLIIKPVGELI